MAEIPTVRDGNRALRMAQTERLIKMLRELRPFSFIIQTCNERFRIPFGKKEKPLPLHV